MDRKLASNISDGTRLVIRGTSLNFHVVYSAKRPRRNTFAAVVSTVVRALPKALMLDVLTLTGVLFHRFYRGDPKKKATSIIVIILLL